MGWRNDRGTFRDWWRKPFRQTNAPNLLHQREATRAVHHPPTALSILSSNPFALLRTRVPTSWIHYGKRALCRSWMNGSFLSPESVAKVGRREGWGYWIGMRSSGWNFPVSGIKSSQLGNCIHDSCMNYWNDFTRYFLFPCRSHDSRMDAYLELSRVVLLIKG